MTKDELRADRIAAIKCRIKTAKKNPRRTSPMRPPRYDDVYFEGVARMNRRVLGCTCGSGAHPRRCTVHPDVYEEHIKELNEENETDWGDEEIDWTEGNES